MSISLLATLPQKSPVWSTSFHPTNPNILLITQKNEAIIFGASSTENGVLECLEGRGDANALTFREITTLNAHNRTVRRAVWENIKTQNPKIALCSFDGTVSLWKRQVDEDSGALSYEILTCLEGHENEVKSVRFADKNAMQDDSMSYIATCARDRTVWVWAKEERVIDDEMEQDDEDSAHDEDYEVVAVCNGHTQDVKDVMWHKSEPILLSCSYDDTIRTWIERLDDWFCCNILRDHSGTVWSMSQNSNGSLMVSVSDDLSMIIWKFIKYTDAQKIQDEDRPFTYEAVTKQSNAHARSIYAVAWSPDDRCIVTVGGDNALRVWTLEDSSQPITAEALQGSSLTLRCEYLDAHASDVNSVSFYEGDSRLLVTGSDDESVKLWRLDV